MSVKDCLMMNVISLSATLQTLPQRLACQFTLNHLTTYLYKPHGRRTLADRDPATATLIDISLIIAIGQLPTDISNSSASVGFSSIDWGQHDLFERQAIGYLLDSLGPSQDDVGTNFGNRCASALLNCALGSTMRRVAVVNDLPWPDQVTETTGFDDLDYRYEADHEKATSVLDKILTQLGCFELDPHIATPDQRRNYQNIISYCDDGRGMPAQLFASLLIEDGTLSDRPDLSFIISDGAVDKNFWLMVAWLMDKSTDRPLAQCMTVAGELAGWLGQRTNQPTTPRLVDNGSEWPYWD